VIGAFRHTAPGCEGDAYRSELVARIADADSIESFRDRVAAINSRSRAARRGFDRVRTGAADRHVGDDPGRRSRGHPGRAWRRLP